MTVEVTLAELFLIAFFAPWAIRLGDACYEYLRVYAPNGVILLVGIVGLVLVFAL